MKRTLPFLLLLFLIPVIVFGQVKIAPEGGVTIFNQFGRQKAPAGHGTDINATDFLPGFRAGINADITLTENFSLQAGLFYVMNRTGEVYSSHTDPVSLEQKEQLMIHYVQLPLYALYESGASGCGRFFIGAGPVFSYALGGNVRTTLTQTYGKQVQTIKTVQNMEIGNELSDQIRPFNFSLGATAGYEFPQRAYVRGAFYYGLTNLKPGGNADNMIKNVGFSLSLGFYINSGTGKGW